MDGMDATKVLTVSSRFLLPQWSAPISFYFVCDIIFIFPNLVISLDVIETPVWACESTSNDTVLNVYINNVYIKFSFCRTILRYVHLMA